MQFLVLTHRYRDRRRVLLQLSHREDDKLMNIGLLAGSRPFPSDYDARHQSLFAFARSKANFDGRSRCGLPRLLTVPKRSQR